MTIPGLLASTLGLAAFLVVFVVVASVAVRSHASAALVLLAAVGGLVGLRALDRRRKSVE